MTPLVPHASTPPRAVRLGARAARTASELRLGWRLDGDVARVRLPPPGAPRRGDRLWGHTCFEAFVGADGEPAYVELNVSPSLEWAAYAFVRRREGGTVLDAALEPRLRRRTAGALELDAAVPLAALAPSFARAVLRVGLSAVVEHDDGALSYWALRHAPGAPDFHHPDAFALRLEPA
jgi:hypothetical protein